MSDIYQDGINRINKLIDHYKWPKNKTVFIEGLRNFGDVLHASVVVRHFRSVYPENHMIVWAISEKYYKQFNLYAEMIGIVILPLPHAEPEIRQRWKKYCDGLGFLKSCFPLCAVSGFNHSGNIVDNVLKNADIKKLNVPRKPFLPHDTNDYSWHDHFCI
jgi:hypothetical protein